MDDERTITIPDGEGNMVQVRATDVRRLDTDAAEKGLEHAREGDFFIRVGHCTEALHKFLKAYIIDYGLTQEEAIAAVYLMNINNREFAPNGTENWPEYYDGLCQTVWKWFQEHKEQ
ncbi:MAG: hypothetical protein DRP83_01410 [Planctomycetota bacterium]|nr:MAG: hypothetical protein DRP83_01410 [Planctomycetota bacterium]